MGENFRELVKNKIFLGNFFVDCLLVLKTPCIQILQRKQNLKICESFFSLESFPLYGTSEGTFSVSTLLMGSLIRTML